jgi:hypothetical protein
MTRQAIRNQARTRNTQYPTRNSQYATLTVPHTQYATHTMCNQSRNQSRYPSCYTPLRKATLTNYKPQVMQRATQRDVHNALRNCKRHKCHDRQYRIHSNMHHTQHSTIRSIRTIRTIGSIRTVRTIANHIS